MIRPARPDDGPALAALQSYLDAPAPELLATYAAASTCLVSVDAEGARGQNGPGRPADARPVGYALAVGDDDAYLAEIVVHPEYRREGRARALLRGVIVRRAPGDRVTLTVAADNEPARSLYESVGFRRVDRRPGFYGSVAGVADDAVVYAYDVGRGGGRE